MNNQETANKHMALGFILAFIFPLAGIIVGIYQLAKGWIGPGMATILSSILTGVLWYVFFTD